MDYQSVPSILEILYYSLLSYEIVVDMFIKNCQGFLFTECNSIVYYYSPSCSACYNFLTVNPTNDQYPDFPNIACEFTIISYTVINFFSLNQSCYSCNVQGVSKK